MAVDTPSPPDPSSGAYGGVRQMAGVPSAGEPSDEGMAGGAPSAPDPAQILSQTTSQIRQADQTVTEIAKRFPQAAPEARRAREALRALLQKIVSQPGGGAPAAPQGEV